MAAPRRLIVVIAVLGIPLAATFSTAAGVRAPGVRIRLLRTHPLRAAPIMDLSDTLTTAAILAPGRYDAVHTLSVMAADATDPEKLSWFDQYVRIIQELIVGLHGLLTSAGAPYAYGLSIFLFTLCVKLFTLPLNWKQMESTAAVQKLQPRTKQLQKWFGENQQALALETSQLYQNNNVNPLAGCLPSVAQIPVFIGLYRAIIGLSKDEVLTESFLWLPSLEGPVTDYGKGIGWLTENWVDGHPALGWHDTLCYLTIPAILVVSQSISMRILAPPIQDDNPQAQQTQQILKFLPLMIGWFSLSAPAGLGLYWFFNNVLTTAQSLFIKSMIAQQDGQADQPQQQSAS